MEEHITCTRNVCVCVCSSVRSCIDFCCGTRQPTINCGFLSSSSSFFFSLWLLATIYYLHTKLFHYTSSFKYQFFLVSFFFFYHSIAFSSSQFSVSAVADGPCGRAAHRVQRPFDEFFGLVVAGAPSFRPIKKRDVGLSCSTSSSFLYIGYMLNNNSSRSRRRRNQQPYGTI